jgi:hypothetical protein
MKERLGLEIIFPPDLDTDRFGAFSGEITRPGTMDEVLEAKARAGMAASRLSIGIASEGSYGPHPQIPFITSGLEKLILIDSDTDLVVIEERFDPTPVSQAWVVCSGSEVKSRLAGIGFPEQGLIVKPQDAEDLTLLKKGIIDVASLENAVDELIAHSPAGRAIIETEMRAHLNPRRFQTAIRDAPSKSC